MKTSSIQAIVLAAGRSTRMHTGRTKLVEPICGQEMVTYVVAALAQLALPITVVVGYQDEAVKQAIAQIEQTAINFVEQREQKGTGHALMQTLSTWHSEHILVINGDMPLITASIINQLIAEHIKQKAAISFITTHYDQPSTSYGRVIKDKNRVHIVEASDFHGDPTIDCCINAGVYIVDRQFLSNHITRITHQEHTQEWYITDLIKIASDDGLPITMISAPFDSVRGVNTFEELWIVEQIKRTELIRRFMGAGVRFSFPNTVHIDSDVALAPGTVIGAGVHLYRGTTVGAHCAIHPYSILSNCTIADHCTIYGHTIIENTLIERGAQIGPFVHVRSSGTIEQYATIGNFVELKETTIGAYSKAKHLTYLGNTTVGTNVNIGAGTISCNHDGKKKQKTVIQDGAYIGSNTTLVAPVVVEEYALTAAGSIITDTVPAGALAIARSRQINKENYAKRYLYPHNHHTIDTVP